MKTFFAFSFVALCTALTVLGQSPAVPDSVRRANAPIVTARFVPDSVGLGDRFRLRLEVTKDIMQQIGWPEGKPGENGQPTMFTDHIEQVADLPQDTVRVEGRRVTLSKEWELTCFKDGWHGLKHIPVLFSDKNIVDSVYARPDSIMIFVGTFEIDTLTQQIYDIKPVLGAPLRFGEFSGWLLMAWALVALIIVGILIYIDWKRNGRPFWAPREKEPPHLAAIRALEALSHQKLWQNNKHKQYYTLLADIVRTYIEGRYGVAAMEMTSDELLGAMRGLDLPERNRRQLTTLFSVADLAKFAKYTPPAEDNESCYNDAYYFVEDTKPAEEEQPTQEKS